MCRWIGSPVGLPSTKSRCGRRPGRRGHVRFGRRPAGEAGFTLIEVLVAFAVLAIVIVPLLQVFGDGLGSTQTARAYARAALLAQSKLDEVGVDAPLVEGEESGSFDEPGFRWRMQVARDTSEVIAPQPPTDSRERRRSRNSDKTSTTGSGMRSGSGFGTSSGFGSSTGLSTGSGSAGGSRSGFGLDKGSRFGSQSSSRAGAGVDEDELLNDEQTLMVYRVLVTVEWGRGAGNSLTLSTLRVRRPSDENGDDSKGNSDKNSDRGRERTSSFGRDRSGSSSSRFGSSFGSNR